MAGMTDLGAPVVPRLSTRPKPHWRGGCKLQGSRSKLPPQHLSVSRTTVYRAIAEEGAE